MRDFIKYFIIGLIAQIVIVPITLFFTDVVVRHYFEVRFGLLNRLNTDEAGIGGGLFSLVSVLFRPALIYAFCFGLLMFVIMKILRQNKGN